MRLFMGSIPMHLDEYKANIQFRRNSGGRKLKSGAASDEILRCLFFYIGMNSPTSTLRSLDFVHNDRLKCRTYVYSEPKMWNSTLSNMEKDDFQKKYAIRHIVLVFEQTPNNMTSKLATALALEMAAWHRTQDELHRKYSTTAFPVMFHIDRVPIEWGLWGFYNLISVFHSEDVQYFSWSVNPESGDKLNKVKGEVNMVIYLIQALNYEVIVRVTINFFVDLL